MVISLESSKDLYKFVWIM